MIHSDQKPGHIDLARLLDAINSIDCLDIRYEIVEALRLHDPETRYFTDRNGRVDAVQ